MMTRIVIMMLLLGMSLQIMAEDKALTSETIVVRDMTIDSRIRNYPATVETYDRQQIQQNVNAATPAQAMKYMPSIQVRERYIG
ncbi:MAG: TonB-dependent receptor, partial [Methylophilaceae bacterium]